MLNPLPLLVGNLFWTFLPGPFLLGSTMSRPGKLCFALAVGASTAYLLVRRRIQERKQRGRVVIASCDEIVESRRAYEIAAADEKGFFRQLTETGVDYDFKSWTDDTVDWGKYRVVVCRSMWDYSESPDKHARFVQWVEKVRAAALP